MEKGYTYTSRKTNLHIQHTVHVISQYHDIFYNFNKKKKEEDKIHVSKRKEKKKEKRGNNVTCQRLVAFFIYDKKNRFVRGVACLAIGKIAPRPAPVQFAWKVTCRLQFSRFLCAINVLDAAPVSVSGSFVSRPLQFYPRARTAFLRSFAYAFSGWIPLRYIISKIRVLRIDREKGERLEVSDYIVEKRRRVKAG